MLSHRAQNRRALGMEAGWVGGAEDAEEGPLVGGEVFGRDLSGKTVSASRHDGARSRIFLLGAAGEQEENGLGASASGAGADP